MRPFSRHISLVVMESTENFQLPHFLLFITTFRLEERSKHSIVWTIVAYYVFP